jgi:uncharacterized coiled-coil protein SlyX
VSERLDDLEIQLTHQQKMVDELNELIYSQQQEIDRLSSELRQIKEQLQIVLPSLNRAPEDEEPPPHY